MVRNGVWLMLALALPVLAQAPAVVRLDGKALSAAEVDATVAKLMAEGHVQGLGLALFAKGHVSHLKAYGLRDVGKSLSLTPDSVLTAASLTKPAFAYLVMRLVDEGRLDLDRPIHLDLPAEAAVQAGYGDLVKDVRWTRITPRMLLDHSSGLPNWRWLTEDRKLALFFKPGSRFAYSGEGIELLQRVVERRMGEGLESLMATHVFKPLGMGRSSMVWQPRFETDFANGYDEAGRSLGPQRREKAGAAGGLQTTLADYARFLEAVMAGRGLSPKSRAEMLASQIRIRSAHEFPTLAPETTRANDAIRLSYGLGWGLYWTPWGKAFFKEGHDDGLRHYAVCFDATGTGLLVMTNSSNGEGLYKALLEGLLGNPCTPLEWERFTPYDAAP